MNSRTRTITTVMGAIALLAACGDDSNSLTITQPVGTPSDPRTIEIAMVDIAFEPTSVTVRPGETIRFRFDNEGFLPHEAIFGDDAVQEEHDAEMQAAGGSNDGMNMDSTTDVAHNADGNDTPADDHEGDEGDEPDADGGHDEQGGPPALSLEPGETGEILITFDEARSAGTIIGCHVPGHWRAGMRLDVAVEFA